jgi:predicted Zn-dependent protease
VTDGEDQFDKDLTTLYELGSRGRCTQMQAIIKKWLPTYPDHHDLLYFSAWIDWREDRDADAMVTVQRLLEHYPESRDGRLLYFELLDGADRLAEAEAVIIGLIKDYPEDASLFGAYSLLMLRAMHVDKAGELAQAGLRLGPDDELCLSASVFHQVISQPGGVAIERMENLVRTHPESVRTACTMMTVLSDRGRYKEALAVAQGLLRQYPDSEEIVDNVVTLKAASHWSMKPLWPFQRWGWGASIAAWFIIVLGLKGLQNSPLQAGANTVGFAVLFYVVYSWVWPPLLRRLMR